MADDLSQYEIYWTKEEQENDIFNDNVHRSNNRKTLGKMEGNHRNDNNNHGSKSGDLIPEKDVTPKPGDRKAKKSKHAEKSIKVKEKPSLKDLRPEDKKRVANLIRELAKAGEEKEVALEQLHVERQEFEHQMKDLHYQVDEIGKEREMVQKQYLECQKMLANYQQQLAEEQERVSQMNQIIKSTPKKHRSKRHKSPLSQGVLQGGSPSSSVHQLSPAQSPASSHHSYHDHHQPPLNGYPPPVGGNHGNQLYPQQANGYQPLIFHNQLRGQNGVKGHLHHHPYAGGQNTDATDDFNFQPVMSSTQRSSHHQHAKPSRRHREHVNRLYAIHNQQVPSSQPSNSSPEFLPSQHSRTHSGEFQPLLPEPDNDSESTSPLPPPSSQLHDGGNEFLPLPVDSKSNRTWPGVSQSAHPNGSQSYHYSAQEVPPESFRSLTPQHRQKELMKQRELLEEEQVWLRQKLAEQEKLLALKQAQLTETELLYLQSGDPKCNAPSVKLYPYGAHAGLGVEPPPVQRQRYALFPTADGDAISTNFPPEEFDEFGQSRVLTKSMHGLGLGHDSSSHQSLPEWSPSSVSSSTRHRRRSREGGRKSPRRRDSYGELNRAPSRSHSQFDVSYYSASKSKRKHRGSSVSSTPSNASTSTMSSIRHHHRNKVKHMATSPLYRDASTAVSPYSALSPKQPSLSPGKVEVTRAPTSTSYNRPSSSMAAHQHPSRLQGNLALPSNRQRTSPSATTQHRETLQLTDLIDSLDDSPRLPRTPVSRTQNQHVSRVHNDSPRSHLMMTRSPYQGPTPELFSEEEEVAMETNEQESRILEDVFFVV